ncbi:mid1-interacting protein 1-B-like [Nerophis ophidion]|uniref:mid1-interacting protein 1-B-like n=1 Tax=Nerophis ophidion TaxID=159077 RepID=UPI002AE06264|nr:mid1-interacting protein 1-B-like [Nerophis ophidion]
MLRHLPETPKPKNSVFNAMNRFLGAVNNMDQTVMVPSLLRDVPLDEDAEPGYSCPKQPDVDEADMYSYYQLLKSIRQDIEWGVRVPPALAETPPRLTRINSNASFASFASSLSASSEEDEYEEEEDDLQKQLQYHLAGLQGVLSKLTTHANSLTRRYKQEIGL